VPPPAYAGCGATARNCVLLAERAAARAGVPLRRWRIGGWTDPVLARLAGLPAISLLSVRDGGFPNYHRPTDTPDKVDWGCVEACVEVTAAAIAAWSEQSPRK
jgi:hypothetical protein